MSTAVNHMKRSHRSQHRSMCYTGSRNANIRPTIGKKGAFANIAMIRHALKKIYSKEEES